MGENNAAKSAGHWWTGVPRWAKITLIVLALLIAAFAIRVALTNQSLVGSVHQRNFHNLSVAARGLQEWPRNIGLVARNRYSRDPEGNDELFHPDIGAYRIRYPACAEIADLQVFRQGRSAGQETLFRVADWFDPADPGKARIGPPPASPPPGSKCHLVEVPLDRLINLRESASHFSHLLILASDGSVVAQIGDNDLPVTQIEEFAPPNELFDTLTRQFVTANPAASAPAAVKLGDAGGTVVIKKFAGQQYRAYVKPFRVEGHPNACPRASRPPAPSALTINPGGTLSQAVQAPVFTPPSGLCYAVGLMPESQLKSAWLAPPPLTLVGFGLALVGFVALLPLVRLLLIGSAETISPIEAIGVLFGIQAAAALAALAVLFTAEVVAERRTARDEARAVATRLASQADFEIATLLGRVLKFRGFDGSAESLVATNACGSVKADKRYPGELFQCGQGQGRVSLEVLLFFDEFGAVDGDYPGIAFHDNVTVPQSVGDRDYFKALRRGETMRASLAEIRKKSEPEIERMASFAALSGARLAALPEAEGDCAMTSSGEIQYTMGQVRAQTDGSAKTVFALACDDPIAGERYALAATSTQAFLAPVLPYPLRFLVVDLSRPNLPVIFHDNRYRAGTENFAERVEGGAIKLAALRQLAFDGKRNEGRNLEFSIRYDGEKSDFVARKLHHANWAVLVYAPRNAVDAIPATTAFRAVFDWFSLALLVLFLVALRLLYKPEDWRELWPDEAEGDIYVRCFRQLLVLAIVAATIVALPLTGWVSPLVALLVALAAWAGALFWFNSRLRVHEQTAKALTPKTEHDYERLCLALLLCIAVIPMAALWSDSRELSRELADGRRATEAARSIVERHDRHTAVARTLKIPVDKWSDPRAGFPNVVPARVDHGEGTTVKTVESRNSFTRSLWETQFFLGAPRFRRCENAPERAWLCLDADVLRGSRGRLAPEISIVPQLIEWRMTGVQLFFYALLIGAMIAAIVTVVLLALKSMMGFGVPLGAVKPEPFDPAGIPKRTLLVAPQAPVRSWFKTKPSKPWDLDLADVLLTTPSAELPDQESKKRFERLYQKASFGTGQAPKRLLVSGISLILRDTPRRRAALKMLETADRMLERKELDSIVIISDFSPLERILDAFDNEESSDSASVTVREELRWARLFQRFSTKQFKPVEKVYMTPKEVLKHHEASIEAEDKHLGSSPDTDLLMAAHKIRELGKLSFVTHPLERGTHALVEELRWLPSEIINSLLQHLSPDMGKFVGKKSRFPIPAKVYLDAYTPRVLEWAEAQKMPSPAAAIDYLRSVLIEYYEQCWASSTLSERLVLEAIARGHFVNMRHTIAMQSLVRRGLVILDPAPRLMNRSFAQFVSQAERPDTLRRWRARQPRSGWLTARLPIIVGIGAAAVLLAVAAAQSGQEFSAMIALLAAGGPALLNIVFRVIRPAG